jgi:hypothetical protein
LFFALVTQKVRKTIIRFRRRRGEAEEALRSGAWMLPRRATKVGEAVEKTVGINTRQPVAAIEVGFMCYSAAAG